jgi:hypothetical protein
MATSEFLLNGDDLAALARMAPAKWGRKNVEAVLATQVIQGNSGPPRNMKLSDPCMFTGGSDVPEDRTPDDRQRGR